MCDLCAEDEEADELVDGKPYCKAHHVCKHLLHNDHKKSWLSCDPNCVLLCTGISKPLETIKKLSAMSVDGMGLPTLGALNWLDFEIDLDTNDFADCIGAWIVQWREEIARRRNKNG